MITLTLLSACIACFCVLLHYVIGSPSGAEYFGGRPFSFYGRFITVLYAKHEDKEEKRLNAKKEALKADLDQQFLTKFRSIAEMNKAQDDYLKGIQDIEHQYRPNFANALGCCFICFSTWVSMIGWIISILFLKENLLLLPLLVPVSVVIANRLKL